MILTFKSRSIPFAKRKALKLGFDRLYFFFTTEAPRTGYYRKTEHGYVCHFTALKYSAIMVF